MMDPVLELTTRLAVGALFVAALFHKLRAIGAFRETVAAYGIVPAVLAPSVALAVVAAEAVVLVLLAGDLQHPTGLVAAGCLLLAYAGAIAVNLVRGRDRIDCGCVGSAASTPPAATTRTRALGSSRSDISTSWASGAGDFRRAIVAFSRRLSLGSVVQSIRSGTASGGGSSSLASANAAFARTWVSGSLRASISGLTAASGTAAAFTHPAEAISRTSADGSLSPTVNASYSVSRCFCGLIQVNLRCPSRTGSVLMYVPRLSANTVRKPRLVKRNRAGTVDGPVKTTERLIVLSNGLQTIDVSGLFAMG